MKTKNLKRKLKAQPGGSLKPDCSAIERRWAARMRDQKRGKLIRVRCWTEEINSAAETHAKTILKAAMFIRKHGPMHANWVMEFRSEPLPNDSAQAGRVRGARYETEARARPCLQRIC